MGQKLTELSAIADDEFGLSAENMSVDTLTKVDGDNNSAAKKISLLRQEFRCQRCQNRWTGRFTEEGLQECKKCKTKDNLGKVMIPEDHHLIGICECKLCEVKFTRPIRAHKVVRYLICKFCLRGCTVYGFDLGQGSYQEANRKFVSDWKKIEERKKWKNSEEMKKVEKRLKAKEMALKEKEKVLMKKEREIEKREEEEEDEEERTSNVPEKKEEEEEDERMLCKICFEVECNTVLIPCGHTLCEGCSGKVQKCPFDRRKIENRVRLFLS